MKTGGREMPKPIKCKRPGCEATFEPNHNKKFCSPDCYDLFHKNTKVSSMEAKRDKFRPLTPAERQKFEKRAYPQEMIDRLTMPVGIKGGKE